jgi:hypothetical protein
MEPMAEFRTTVQNPHAREEYLQWARILSRGDPVHGMLVVFVQKLCTAFHEFEPAWQGGLLDERALGHCRERLSARIKTVLDALLENGLGATAMAGEFRCLLESVEAAGSMEELAHLSETVHLLGHSVCDWLEQGE